MSAEEMPQQRLTITDRWIAIPFWWRFVICIGVIVGIFTAVVYAVPYYAQRTIQMECLAQTLDVNLDKWGEKKDEMIFRRQAEAAARIHIRRVSEGKEYFCPSGNISGKVEMTRKWFLSSSKFWRQDRRLVIINEVARAAYTGSYAFAWPPQFACVDEYKATRLRNPLKDRGRYVGSIANMSFYCSGS